MSDTRLPLRNAALTQATTAVSALEALMDTLGYAAHPQEFGMDGCPGCKALEALRDATEDLHAAMSWIEQWQPEKKPEAV